MSCEDQLAQFVARPQHNIAGDEKCQAQIFLDHLIQAFGHPGACFDTFPWPQFDPASSAVRRAMFVVSNPPKNRPAP